jgi:hypothetical protein
MQQEVVVLGHGRPPSLTLSPGAAEPDIHFDADKQEKATKKRLTPKEFHRRRPGH